MEKKDSSTHLPQSEVLWELWDIMRLVYKNYCPFTKHPSMETPASSNWTWSKFLKYCFYFVKNCNGNVATVRKPVETLVASKLESSSEVVYQIQSGFVHFLDCVAAYEMTKVQYVTLSDVWKLSGGPTDLTPDSSLSPLCYALLSQIIPLVSRGYKQVIFLHSLIRWNVGY